MNGLHSRNAVPACRVQADSRIIVGAKGPSCVLPLISVGLILAAAQPPLALARPELPQERGNEESALVQKLLKSSQQNKEKYDQARLADYYKRNFKDYFEFEAGDPATANARGIKSDTVEKIQKWLSTNR